VLRPQDSAFRDRKSLNGLRSANRSSAREMAVPASYNDVLIGGREHVALTGPDERGRAARVGRATGGAAVRVGEMPSPIARPGVANRTFRRRISNAYRSQIENRC
jgi:hypothetical protein